MPALIAAMERHGHLARIPEIRDKLLAMSAATIDRALARVREGVANADGTRRTRCVEVFQYGPGQIGTIRHRGWSRRPRSAQWTVRARQLHPNPRTHCIATGWTECAPLIVREQTLLSTVLTELRKQMPFALLGFGTDNDTVFMKETLKVYCDTASIVFTRCRLYRKNDQAFVEQTSAIVRRMVGYRRFDGLEAAKLLAELYRSARLFVSFFQPSLKLVAKQRDAARVRKTYSAPATPHRRCAADARTVDAVRAHLQEIYAALDPVASLRDIRAAQERIAAQADTQPVAHAATASLPIDLFLASLDTG